MTTEAKICAGCGAKILRPRDYSHRQWAERCYCGLKCAGQFAHITDPITEFWRQNIPEPNSGCWLWLGHLNRQGYGVFRAGGVTRLAHRFSFELHKGPIGRGLGALHHCDNRCCVAPDHLYAGTNRDNVADMVRRGRQAIGQNHWASRLSPDDVRQIRKNRESPTVLAQRYGVTPQAIRAVWKRKTWKHIR